ncbi:pilus assembly protein PilP [Pseudooceanicola sp. C21-150M6]|uniref:pilus assembly protein PilP n=1 Tax=Pseudooceanicola sp. C21-150M6 TaxID=3434355 RepID=UPI003D7F1E2D
MSDTPEAVAREATEHDALDLSTVALLGTMVKPQGPEALIRMANGEVKKVAPGDRLGVGQGRVQAIGAGVVQIARMGTIETLTMPQG